MSNIGVGEIFLVVVLGLIVFGPQKLPEIARNVARAWRTFQIESQKAAGMLKEGLDEGKGRSRSAGVIDRADGANGRPAPRATPRREPSKDEVDRAARVEPADERKLEDT